MEKNGWRCQKISNKSSSKRIENHKKTSFFLYGNKISRKKLKKQIVLQSAFDFKAILNIIFYSKLPL